MEVGCIDVTPSRPGNPLTRYWHRFWTVENAKRMFPPVTWVPKYRVEHFAGDLVAGLTVGLTVVPQALAYAKVANLPLQYGLYSAFIGSFMYSLFGTSREIAVGPTAVISLLVASTGQSPVAGDATYAVFLTFYCGLIHIVMSFLNLGFIVQFISHPVINAFTSAAAITIISTQVKSWLGLKKVRQDFFGAVYDTCSKLPETNLWDAVMGLVCIIILVMMKQLKDRVIDKNLKSQTVYYKKVLLKIAWLFCISRNALIVFITAGISAGMTAHGLPNHLTPTANVTQGLPPFQFPAMILDAHSGNTTIHKETVDIFQDLGVGLAIISIMCILEHIAVGKAFSRKNNYRIDPTQELLAIGICNVMSSFVGSYPVTGSVSRTAVNAASGSKTPAGGIITGAVVMLALGVLTPYFRYIPTAALAAVVITASGDMIDFMIVKSLWTSKRADLVPFFITFLLSFPWGIEYGIIIGTGLNLLMTVYPMSRPDLRIYQLKSTVIESAGNIVDGDGGSITATVIRINPGLLYPGMEYMYDKILKHGTLKSPNQSIVVDCLHCSDFDFTTIHALTALGEDFHKRNLKLILVNLKDSLHAAVTKANMGQVCIARSMDEVRAIIRKLNSQDDDEGNAQTVFAVRTATSFTTLDENNYGSTTRCSESDVVPTEDIKGYRSSNKELSYLQDGDEEEA